LNAGVGLNFIRDLEQGKKTLRLDKVNDVLALFGMQVGVIDQIDKNRLGKQKYIITINWLAIFLKQTMGIYFNMIRSI